jgi:hypothetical protein
VSARQKSQKGFVAVTLMTLLAIAMVLVVYASILGTFTGGDVGVVSLDGTPKYCKTNSTTPSEWKTELTGTDNVPAGDPWYALFNTTSGGYEGNVKITWGLYNSTDSVHNVTTDSFTLDGTVQTIYASGNGLQAENYNWGQNTTVAETYYIKVTVEEV